MTTVEPSVDNPPASGSGPPSVELAAEVKVNTLNPGVSFGVSEKKVRKENSDAVDTDSVKRVREAEIIKKGRVLLKLFQKKVKKQDKAGIIVLDSVVPVSLSTKEEDEWEDENNEDVALKTTKKEHDIERAKRLFMLYHYYKKDRLSGITRVRAACIQQMKVLSRTSTLKRKSFEITGEPDSSSSSYYTVEDSKEEINDANGNASDVDNTQELFVPEDTHHESVSPVAVDVEDESFSGTESSTSSDNDCNLKSILDQFPALQIPPSIVLNKDVGKNDEDEDDDAYDEDNQCNQSWSSDGTQDGDLCDILDLFPIVPQFSVPDMKSINKNNNIKEACKDSEEFEGKQDEVDSNADVPIVKEHVSIEEDNNAKLSKDSGKFEENNEVESITISNVDVPIVEEQVVSKGTDGTKVHNIENFKPKVWHEREGGGDSKEDEDNISESSSCSRFSTLDLKACDLYFPIPSIWIVVSDYDEDKVTSVDIKTMKEREGSFLEKDHELDTLTLNSGPCNFYFSVPGIWIRVSVYEDDLRKEEVMKDAEDMGENKEDVSIIEGGCGDDAGAAITDLSRAAFAQEAAPLKEYLIPNNADPGSSISSFKSFVTTCDPVNNEDELDEDEDDDEYSAALSTIDLLGLFPSVPPIVIIKTKPIENVDDDETYTWDCEICESLVHGRATFVFDEDIWHNPWACGKGLEDAKVACAELDEKTIDSVKDGVDDEITTSAHFSTSDSSSTFDPDQTLKEHPTDVKRDEVDTDDCNVLSNIKGDRGERRGLWFKCDDANEGVEGVECGDDIHGVAVREKVSESGERCLEGVKRANDSAFRDKKPPPGQFLRHDANKTDNEGPIEHYITDRLQNNSIITYEAEKEDGHVGRAEEYQPNFMALIVRGSRQLQCLPRCATHVPNVSHVSGVIISTFIINNEHHRENMNNSMAHIVRGFRELKWILHCTTHNSHIFERRRTITSTMVAIEGVYDGRVVYSNLALIVRGPREVQRVAASSFVATVIKTVNNEDSSIQQTVDNMANEEPPLCQDLTIYTAPLFLPLSPSAPPLITLDSEITLQEIGFNRDFDILLQLFAPYIAIIVVLFVASFTFVQGSGEISNTPSPLQEMPGCFGSFGSDRRGEGTL